MAVEIAYDPKHEVAIMWDNTTDTAFGPVFSGPSADTEIQEFLDWLAENGSPSEIAVAAPSEPHDGTDPRHYPADELERLVSFWCKLPTAKNAVSVVREPDPPELWVVYVNGERKSQHETKDAADSASMRYRA